MAVYKRLDPMGLAVDTNKITWAKKEELESKIVEIKIKHSLYSRFPMMDGESMEEWQKRIGPELLKEQERKADESSPDFIKRLVTGDSSKLKKGLIFDTLKAIAEIFDNASKVTEDSFGQTPISTTKNYIKDILTLADIDASAFE